MPKGVTEIPRTCMHCSQPFTARNGSVHHCSTECLFWSKVDRRGPDECWLWTGHVNKDGYGSFHKIARQASRVALIIAKGPIDPGLLACHTCNNPPCCNPAHLYAGTVKQNVMDAVDDGKFRGRHKLSEADVLEVRRKLSAGALTTEIAQRYGITRSAVKRIASGRAWRWVTGGTPITLSQAAEERRREATRQKQSAWMTSFQRERKL